MLTNVYQIRKIVVANYCLLSGELIFGLLLIYFFPAIPLKFLIISVGIGLAINFIAHIALAFRASIKILQALIILEMIVSTVLVTLVSHFFTDVRPVVLMIYLPIIMFSNILSADLGVFNIIFVGVSYMTLNYFESTGGLMIQDSIIANTKLDFWQEVSIFALIMILLNGVLTIYLKRLSTSKSATKIDWPDRQSHQDLIKKELNQDELN